jgi:hypothetical protein
MEVVEARRAARIVASRRSEVSELSDYEPLDLAGLCNVGLEAIGGGRPPPIGDQVFHGLPFRIGDPSRPEAASFIRIMPGETVTVPVNRAADRVIVTHFRVEAGAGDWLAPGQVVAEYRFRLSATEPTAGTEPTTGTASTMIAVPIRERLEIAARPGEFWDANGPFLATSSTHFGLPDRYEGRWDEVGWRQTEVSNTFADYYMWTWENPHPLSAIDTIEIQAVGVPVLIAAVTIGNAREHPFRREAARTLRFTALGPDGPQPLREPVVDVDRGVAA